MENIELVIKIPKETYNFLQRYGTHGGIIEKAVLDATPLPKGHGRIVDMNKALDVLAIEWGYEGIEDDLESKVPTIIEADKGDKE